MCVAFWLKNSVPTLLHHTARFGRFKRSSHGFEKVASCCFFCFPVQECLVYGMNKLARKVKEVRFCISKRRGGGP